MEIKYLLMLKNNPAVYPNDPEYEARIKSISISEILQLEQTWNNGKEFPAALRELLFLAGDFCYVLDTGLMESQQEMQEEARQWLSDFNRTISRPFYVIDVYNAGEGFLFVYLDEGEDPKVNCTYLPHRDYDDASWLSSTDRSLSNFINSRINDVKQGYNPF